MKTLRCCLTFRTHGAVSRSSPPGPSHLTISPAGYLVDCCQAGVCVVIDYGPIPPGSVYAVSSTTLVVTRATPTLASTVALPVFSELPSVITSGVVPVTSGAATSSAESASGTAAGTGNGGGPGLASFSGKLLSIGDARSLAIAALGVAFVCNNLL